VVVLVWVSGAALWFLEPWYASRVPLWLSIPVFVVAVGASVVSWRRVRVTRDDDAGRDAPAGGGVMGKWNRARQTPRAEERLER
jgi:membrane protein implicated in regulation of membrane protease activity